MKKAEKTTAVKPKKKRNYKAEYKRRKAKLLKDRPPIDLTGLTLEQIEELLRTSGNKLNMNDLQKVLKRLNDTANQRLKNLEKSGKKDRSFAYKQAKKKLKPKGGRPKKGSKAKPKSKGKKEPFKPRFKAPKGKRQRGKYQKAITNVLKFLKAKSSKVSGVNEIIAKIESEVGHFENDDQIKDFFDTYHRMLEELGISRERSDNVYLALRGILYDLMNGDNPLGYDDAVKRMEEIIDRIEEEGEERLGEMNLDELRELASDFNQLEEDEENYFNGLDDEDLGF